MSSQNSQVSKKKTVKELNVYSESLEKRIVLLEDIIKALNIDPNQVEESNKAESENLKKIEKLEKRINTLDKKIKHLENVNSEKKEKPPFL